MKTKFLSVILSAIILSTSAAILTGCGGEKESVAKIATSDEAATKIETVTEVATDEQGSTQIVEETKVIEETTTTNSKSESSENSETKSNDSSASKKSSTGNKTISNSASTSKNNNSVSSKTNSNSTSVKKNSNKNNSSTPAKKSSTVLVSSVSLSKSSMSVTVGKSSSFTVTINPSNATNRDYTASTSNGNATVNCSGSTVTVKGISKGSCTVTVKSNNGKTAKCSVTVKAKSKPKPAKVTDDTPLTRSEFYTDENMKRLCDAVNKHFIAKGMSYGTYQTFEDGDGRPFDKDHTGWFFVPETDFQGPANYKIGSFNHLKQDIIEYFESEVQANLMDEPGDRYEDIMFRCYYERVSNGGCDIYFCYG